jgi:hypothetical protein
MIMLTDNSPNCSTVTIPDGGTAEEAYAVSQAMRTLDAGNPL